MTGKVQKWGNSLALRIPKSLALQSNLSQGSAVEMRVTDGRLVIEPQRIPRYRLADLLKNVARKNTHPEIPTGRPVGREEF